MDNSELVTTVVETIAKVQELSGRSSVGIEVSTRPILDVEGFDSLSGVEATVMLSESLGVDIPDDCNPFISEDGKQASSIVEVADTLRAYVGLGA